MYLEQESERYREEKTYWADYLCVCGNHIKARYFDVKNGKKKSCGCIRTNTKHGMWKHRIYGIWSTMIARCNYPSHKSYYMYGEIGISVCDRWLNIENFIEDMYPTYKEGLSIDRINNDGNYEPSNCRWTTKTTQSRNRKMIMSTNTSGYKGVSFNKANKKWVAVITVNSNKIYLGSYSDVIEAALSYNNYVIDNNLEHTLNTFKD